MSLRASGNRAINEAEAACQGLGRTVFWPVHDASLMIWSPNRACSLCHMSLDATKCNKMQHFWHFRGCCMVRHPTLEVGTRSRACRAVLPLNTRRSACITFLIIAHRTSFHASPPTLRVVGRQPPFHKSCTKMHQNAPLFRFFPTPLPMLALRVALSLPRLP